MNATEAHALVRAVRAHFTRGYDFFKFNGKTRGKRLAEDDQDRRHYDRISQHRDPRGLVVATLVDDPRAYVGDIAHGHERYVARRRVIESMTHYLREELRPLGPDIGVWVEPDGSHPRIIRAHLAGAVSLEVAALVGEAGGAFSYWRRNYRGDPIVEQVVDRLERYAPFVDYSRDGVRRIIVDICAEAA